VEGLLQRLERFALSSEELRGWRAIEVLEHLGTPEAREVLERLGQGAATSRLTQAARAARARLLRGPVGGR
jgi:hypothetical protein